MKNNRVIIIALAITVLLSCVILVMFLGTDHQGPVITVDSSAVKPYAKEQGTDTLKQYAKAIDKVDGNVSDSVMIENVYVMPDLKSAKIIYTARDKKNNISKLSYMIEYAASDEEIAQASGEKQTEQSESETQSTTVASDGKNQTTTADSKNKTTAAEVTTEAATKEGAPKLTLSATEATINAGSAFYISKYIENIKDDSDSMSDLSKRMIIKGDYNTKTPGDYTLDVYCTNKGQIESNHVKFILHVK